MEAIMKDTYISEAVKYIGADDTTLDLFESQYQIPNGVSYNSYVILDEKVAVMDTIDERKTDEWFEKGNDVNIRFLRVDLKALMNGENPDPVGNTNPADYITIRFGETTLSSTTQYGTGIQYPMYFLGNECKVNLLIRAKLGFTAETSTVIPYLYTISYNKSK